MWERFSFYGLKALLILFMTASAAQGGLGFTAEKGGAILGWYGFGVYATAILGGWAADRVWGQYRSVLIGGIIIALGHFSMAIPTIATFYLGLCLIMTGTGLLKPNASTMVGALYDEDDARRDAGFSIFYVGINVGAFTAPLIVGTLGQEVNWHAGFACAGVGMVIGLIQYVSGKPSSTRRRTRSRGGDSRARSGDAWPRSPFCSSSRRFSGAHSSRRLRV